MIRSVGKTIFGLLFILLPALSLGALDARYGSPLITSFTPEDYLNEGQCFDVAITPDNLVYVANAGGVLEYDGQKWTTIQGTEHLVVFSLASDSQSRIWVGSRTDTGVLARNEKGILEYHSLVNVFPDSAVTLKNVWRIHDTPDGIYFQSPKLLVRWRPDRNTPLEGEFDVWEADGHNFMMACWAGGQLLIKRHYQPLEYLKDDEIVPYPGLDSKSPGTVIHAMDFDESTVMLTNYHGNLLLLKDNQLIPFEGPVTELEDNELCFGIHALSENRYVMASSTLGLIVFDNKGNILEIINESSGLPSKTINRYVKQDKTGGVWVPLDYGLARVELSAPYRIFSSANDLNVTSVSIAWHEGDLYAGSPGGFQRLGKPTQPGKPPQFKTVPGFVGSAWKIANFANTLAIGTVQGLYAIDKHGVCQVIPAKSGNIHFMITSPDSKNLYAGVELFGIRRYEMVNNWIVDRGTLDLNYDDYGSLRYFDHHMWATHYVQNGRILLRSDYDVNNPDQMEFLHIGPEHGIPDGVTGTPFVWENRLFVNTPTGVVGIDAGADLFVPAEQLLGAPISGEFNCSFEDEYGRLYAAQGPFSLNRYERTAEGAILVHPLLGEVRMRRVLCMAADPQTGLIAFGGEDDRVVVYDPASDTLAQHTPATLLHRVSMPGDSTIAAMISSTGHTPVRLSWPVSSLRFEYSLPAYAAPRFNEYQFRLLGLNSEWTSWTRESYHDFNDLSPGHYEFQVQGRDAKQQIGETASFSFIVLPPWYRTWWAYGLWIILAALTIYGIIQYRLRRVEKQKQRLEDLVAQRTLELEEAQEEELRQMEALKAAEIESQRLKVATQLAAAISHEFNNPLAIILGKVDVALSRYSLEESQEKYHRVIRDQVTRMRDLVIKLRNLDQVREVDYAAGVKMLDLHGSEEKEKKTD